MRDRKSLSRSIAAREENIAAERETEGVVFSNLGQALYDTGAAAKDDPDSCVEAVDRASLEIRNLEESLRILLANEETRKTLLEEARSLKVESRNLKNRMESVYEDLGKASWELWKTGHQPNEHMEEALGDLIKADEKLHSAEVASFRIEKDKTKGASTFLARGKALLLTGRKKTANAAINRQWSKAGRRIHASIDPESLKDSSASVPMATIKALDERVEEIRNRENAISAEIKSLEEALENLPAKGAPRRRVSLIETAIETGRSDLDDAFMALGKNWIGRNLKTAASGEVDKCRREWIAINERIGRWEEDIAVLTAHRDFLNLREERDRKAGKVSHLEEEIKIRQASLRAARKELTGMEKEIAALEETLPPLPDED